MVMKAVYKEGEEVPEQIKDQYKLVGKDHVLDIEGFTTLPDARRLIDEAATTRIKLKKANEGMLAFGDLKPDEVRAQLDRIPDLEAAAEGKLDDNRINEIAETRAKAKAAPIERELNQLKIKVGEQDAVITEFKQDNIQRSIREAVTGAARKVKVVESAVEDAVLLAERVFEISDDGTVVTKDKVGVIPGITPELWLQDMQEKRPHWFGISQGGGANPGRVGGNFTENPFSDEYWNMTKQGEMIKLDRNKAEKAAKAAGTTIGGRRPAPKK